MRLIGVKKPGDGNTPWTNFGLIWVSNTDGSFTCINSGNSIGSTLSRHQIMEDLNKGYLQEIEDTSV